jgi:excisionase family DNA binding protein
LTQPSASNERLAYRPAELAAMVGLSAKAIYRAIARGELRAAKVANGSRLLIPAESAESWLQASAAAPAGQAPARRSSRPPFRRPLSEALSRIERDRDDG